MEIIDNRKAVSIQDLYESMLNPQGYMYNAEAADLDLDPWRMIEGIDMLVNQPKYVIMFGRTGEKIVDPTYQVWISVKDTLV